MTTVALETTGTGALRIHPTRALFMVYMFLAPLGNVARFSTAEAGYGATTVLLLAVVAFKFFPNLRVLRRDKLLFSLAILTAWMVVVSFVTPNVLAGVTGAVGFALYVLFACAAYRINWNSATLHRLLMSFVLGGFVCSLFTIVDFFGIVDIPRFNEGTGLYTSTSLGSVLQASGPFPRRSALATYFALLIPLSAQLTRYIKPLRTSHRLICASTAVMASITLLLTHNRAGLLGAWIAVALISLVTAQSPARFFRLVAAGVAVAAIGVWILVTYFPAQLMVYEALLKIGDMKIEGYYVEGSDEIRLALFLHAIGSLAANPVGNGYTLVSGLPGHPSADAHNIATQIIWAAGVVGIGWLVFFSAVIVRRLRRLVSKESLRDPTLRYGIVIASGLFGWAITGMMHQILGTGVAWLLAGTLIKLSKGRLPARPAPADGVPG